jgi:hypothetical protein
MIRKLEQILAGHGDLNVIISVDGVPGYPGQQLNIDTHDVEVEWDQHNEYKGGVTMITGDAVDVPTFDYR